MYEQRRRGLDPAVWVVLVISWIIILLVARFLFGRDSNSTTDDTTGTDSAATKYFIDQTVELAGVITVSDDITAYSHELITSDGETFGLISTEIPLEASNTPVKITGVIQSFKKGIPLVSVSEFIEDDGTVDEGQSGGEVIYLEKEQILVNMSIFPGSSFTPINDSYQFTDAAGTKQFIFKRASCSASECSTLRSSLVGTDRLSNSAGMTFSQIDDTNNWILFLDSNSYIAIEGTQGVVLDEYVDMFTPIPSTYFVQWYEGFKTLCKNINSRLGTVKSDSVTISSDGTAEITLEGTTLEGKSASCVLTTTLVNPKDAQLESYETGLSVNNDEENDDTPTTDTETVPLIPAGTASGVVLSGSTKPVPAEYAARKAYPSIRGRTMFIEKNIISFNGSYSTGYVGCPYKVNLSLRTNGTGAGADSEFYECTSTAGASALKGAGYTSIGKTDLSEFFRKDITSGLQSVGIYIQ